MGWLLADAGTVERALRVRDVVDAVGPMPSDTLGAAAFQGLDALLERARSILRPGARLLSDFVGSRPELEWVPPDGGSVGFPRLIGVADSQPFTERAARDFDVGVTPGGLFGEPGHVRVAVGGERSALEAGLEALGRALDAGL